MSGFYPDPPGNRVPYDRDGSVGFYHLGGAPTALTSAQVRIFANESGDDVNFGGAYVAIDSTYVGVVFGVHYDLVGYFTDTGQDNGGITIETSPDTTNGVDGTWSAYGTGVEQDVNGAHTNPEYRSSIASAAATGVKGVRLKGTVIGGRFIVRTMHFYGGPTGPTDRLQITDDVLDAPTAGGHFDWGDVAHATTAVKQFRVKNLSPTKVAQSVTLGLEALTEASPPVVGMLTFSFDAVTYTSSLALGDLNPGEISPVIYFQRVFPAAPQAGVWAQRIVAAAAAFL